MLKRVYYKLLLFLFVLILPMYVKAGYSNIGLSGGSTIVGNSISVNIYLNSTDSRLVSVGGTLSYDSSFLELQGGRSTSSLTYSGNGNKSEEYVGYFTKGGDSVSDIKLLSDFFVDEVIEIGKVIDVPDKVLYKTPSDGLSNLSDEDKLGFTYSDVKKVVLGEYVEENIKDMIERKHKANSHKFNSPSYKR